MFNGPKVQKSSLFPKLIGILGIVIVLVAVLAYSRQRLQESRLRMVARTTGIDSMVGDAASQGWFGTTDCYDVPGSNGTCRTLVYLFGGSFADKLALSASYPLSRDIKWYDRTNSPNGLLSLPFDRGHYKYQVRLVIGRDGGSLELREYSR